MFKRVLPLLLLPLAGCAPIQTNATNSDSRAATALGLNVTASRNYRASCAELLAALPRVARAVSPVPLGEEGGLWPGLLLSRQSPGQLEFVSKNNLNNAEGLVTTAECRTVSGGSTLVLTTRATLSRARIDRIHQQLFAGVAPPSRP
ncbi:hypothetical protein [Deinococcus sp. NW-56]|uniref:hypothetical protein n=1 Tax=Deinococcus sp. NW-56 TaxID=2080419 RepID=UPI000CF3A201|nr:hypothetical protein [Deinococcus sp. NW-56]